MEVIYLSFRSFLCKISLLGCKGSDMYISLLEDVLCGYEDYFEIKMVAGLAGPLWAVVNEPL